MSLCILTTITWVTVARGPLPPISVLSRTPLVQKVKRVLGDTLHITNNAAALAGIGESPSPPPPHYFLILHLWGGGGDIDIPDKGGKTDKWVYQTQNIHITQKCILLQLHFLTQQKEEDKQQTPSHPTPAKKQQQQKNRKKKTRKKTKPKNTG